MKHFLLLIALTFAVSCGGGGGGASEEPADEGTGERRAGEPDPGPEEVPEPEDGPTPNPGPQIALLMSNGHSVPANYLALASGPQLQNALVAAGYTVETSYFVDKLGGGTPGGYSEFVQKLRQIRDEWIVDRIDPTRVVIVGHSHGCVRAHAAIRAVPDCPVRLLADLDASSAGWSLFGHPNDNATMGGAPEGAYAIAATITCAAHPSVTSAPPPFDLEDVVFDNVQEAYEVRSGARLLNPSNPLQLIEYDERWNARPDGSTTGLTCNYSGTTHLEVASPGSTLSRVQTWMLARLASD